MVKQNIDLGSDPITIHCTQEQLDSLLLNGNIPDYSWIVIKAPKSDKIFKTGHIINNKFDLYKDFVEEKKPFTKKGLKEFRDRFKSMEDVLIYLLDNPSEGKDSPPYREHTEIRNIIDDLNDGKKATLSRAGTYNSDINRDNLSLSIESSATDSDLEELNSLILFYKKEFKKRFPRKKLDIHIFEYSLSARGSHSLNFLPRKTTIVRHTYGSPTQLWEGTLISSLEYIRDNLPRYKFGENEHEDEYEDM